MNTLFHKIFIKNWQRKLVSLGLAIVIWLFVNHSITETKTFYNIPIKIINIPENKIIEGIKQDGYLEKKITITLTGNKNVLDTLISPDLEIVLDAQGKKDEWIVTINTQNLRCLNPNIDIQKSINKILYPDIIIKIKNKQTTST